MSRFLLRTLLALLPALALVVLYIIKDPFGVLRPEGRLAHAADTVALTSNTGFISVENFNRYNAERRYDSFIFGSSLSGYYRVQDWLPHLPQGASAFHFNASRETLHGILNKLNYLAARGTKVKNALIVMEDEMLKRKPLDGDILYVQHPSTARSVSWWKFHQLYFNAFCHPQLVAYSLFPAAMAQRVIDDGYATTDIPDRIEPLNEGYYRWADSLIAVNPGAFYTPEHLRRYRLPLKTMPCPDKVTPEVEQLLRAIAAVLHEQGTDFQIIIPPHYGYEAISDRDLSMLNQIFGARRVHDYSRDPQLGTDLHCYYDDGHLIAAQCARLIDSAYMALRLVRK